MNISTDEIEYNMSHMSMFENVLDMFKGNPNFQQIVRRGILANINGTQLHDTSEDDDYDYRWPHGYHEHRAGILCGCSRSSSSVYPMRYYEDVRDCPLPSSWKVQAKESDSERQTRLLLEAEKSKEKAEKKRIKKKKQKERKQMERMEKEKQNSVRNKEENDDTQPSKEEKKSEPAEESKSSVKAFAAAKYTECSNSTADESSNEDGDTGSDLADTEELDMTSSFVSKAALIVRRKMEQNPKSERKERKKTQVNEEPETVHDKPNTDVQSEDESKQDPVTSEAPTFEDIVRKSAELANLGNKFASAGDYDRAIMHYTDAIKYNPTEFKFFGNRSFCFEKQRKFVKALTDAELSLSLCPGWVKGLFRKGRALAGLKKYEDAAQAFREVLKVDQSCVEASQELWRVQIAQLMLYGFTRAQSSNALSLHGTVKEAAAFLSKLSNKQTGAYQNGAASPAQVVNVSGVSPVLSANMAAAAPQLQDGAHAPSRSKSWGPAQSQPKPSSDPAPQELYPVWVGNLNHLVTEVMMTNLFNKVGVVHSVKLLTFKRCAFINFTKQEHCDEAIRRFHGFEFSGCRLAVRYPDRIHQRMGISRSAHRADNLQDENVGSATNINGRTAAGSQRPVRGFRPEHRAFHQQ